LPQDNQEGLALESKPNPVKGKALTAHLVKAILRRKYNGAKLDTEAVRPWNVFKW